MVKMLDIQNLHVEVDGKPILNGLDLNVNEGETHALFGQNGLHMIQAAALARPAAICSE